MLKILSSNEQNLIELAQAFAKQCQGSEKIYLHGELGAGKTTFSRGFLRGLGFKGPVKSPTYTLVEIYDLNPIKVYHFDLYRIGIAEELEFIGYREYFDHEAICLVEWPEKANEVLPKPDINCYIGYHQQGRQIHFSPMTDRGQAVLNQCSDLFIE